MQKLVQMLEAEHAATKAFTALSAEERAAYAQANPTSRFVAVANNFTAATHKALKSSGYPHKYTERDLRSPTDDKVYDAHSFDKEDANNRSLVQLHRRLTKLGYVPENIGGQGNIYFTHPNGHSVDVSEHKQVTHYEPK